MPSISKVAATALAVTTALLLPGATAAAIPGAEAEFCDFQTKSSPGESVGGNPAKRQSLSDLESIFGKPPSASEGSSQNDIDSIFGKPPAPGQDVNQNELDSIFGKPPAPGQGANQNEIDSIFGKPPAPGQDANQNEIDSIFGKPPGSATTPDNGRVLNVGLYFHIVGKVKPDEKAEEFMLNRGDIDRQVAAMNKYYTPSNISFQLLDADWTDDVMNSRSRGLSSPIAQRLHKGNLTTLNIFVVRAEELGYGGTSKVDLDGEGKSDGIIIGYRTIPGGTHPVYTDGKTAVHEAGHWLSLQHTAFTKPGHCEHNWLNNPGQGNETCGYACDSNFMSYGTDAWLLEFTTEQIQQMRKFGIEKRGL